VTKLPAAIITIIPSSAKSARTKVFTAEEPTGSTVAARIEQHQRDRDAAHELQGVGQHVIDDHAGERSRRVQRHGRERGPRGRAQHRLRQPERQMAARIAKEEIADQHHARTAKEHDLRQNGREIDIGYHGRNAD
jgi:hypothetical protein